MSRGSKYAWKCACCREAEVRLRTCEGRGACERAGVITEVRKREFYEKPTEERKRKAAVAVKRNYKRVMKDSFAKLK